MLTPNTVLPLPAFSSESLHNASVQRYLAYYQLDLKAQGLCDEQGFGGIDCGRFHIATHQFILKQAKGTLMYIHGYLDHVGSHQKLIKHLLSLGYNVLAFDLPGHGLSSGTRAAITQFDDYQDVLDQLVNQIQYPLPAPFHILGHSTGASIAMSYVFSKPAQPYQSQILLAPLVEPCRFTLIKLGLLFVPYFTQTVKRDFSATSHDAKATYFMQYQDGLQCQAIHLSWLKALKDWQKQFNGFKTISTPTLMVQATNDQTVNWMQNGAKIKSKCKQISVTNIQGAKHHLPLEADTYRSQVMDAIDQFL